MKILSFFLKKWQAPFYFAATMANEKKNKNGHRYINCSHKQKIRRGSITNYFILVNVNNTAPTTTTPTVTVIPPIKKLF